MSVRYERSGPAAVLTIDRPERRNAVDPSTAEGLREGLERFEADPEARALILTGAGDQAFCAGADLKAISGELDEASLRAWALNSGGPLGLTRLTPSKPTIAALRGWCLAGGLELALWCDLRIAGRSCRLGFTERRFGVPLIDGGTQRLPRVIGMGRALEMILTGRLVDASEAHAWGLVNELVDDERVLERALELAESLAAVPQPTMLSDRRAALEGAGTPLSEGLALEAELGREVLPDAARGA
ncbi:MAG: enoyl-CoA hydratase/isomerase family protein, partial [Solirubrobacterales bacterium]|nr:enoyl-CoA hydratase/isomerase family protein [Solirubrobacterales bacterium]